MDDNLTKKHKSTIIQLYVVFIATIIASFVPHMIIQAFALVFFLVLIIAVPVYGAMAPAGSLLKNHMRYLNGTIWWGSLFLFVSVLIMGYWVYSQSDQSAFTALFDRVQSGIAPTEAEMQATIDTYMQANMALLVKASLICVGPPMLYIIYRIATALPRAMKGHRMGVE